MDTVEEELIKGLTSDRKYIPTWFRYDEEGSRLNDLCIKNSSHYYFHRYEVELLQNIVEGGDVCMNNYDVVVDLGSGNAHKTRFFLNKITNSTKQKVYAPVDISSAKSMMVRKKLVLLFGGGILNMSWNEKLRYLSGFSNCLQEDDLFLFSVDITDPDNRQVIENAYNDPEGYCKAFNMNIITRLNKEYSAGIEPSNFEFKAEFVKKESETENSYVDTWIEAQTLCILQIEKLNLTLELEQGDKIYLHDNGGISSKFTMNQLQYLLNQSSLCVANVWRNKHVAVVASYKR